ncbi:ArnT family glycosyltransferase [Cupriavidus metallidurans]|uniref:4-amino-4-deoxy-L-arabinose transferase or related glycosyltransferases of PMT family n=1 Tax=Cupriavidus metallidurans (strain ATCC 43123 / DSM 2839 / NBRC 102507 / CH34) TaxID=266264 RepID=Q1LEH7_CUPMC|nr:glycosyltransferase family 39 protein [Cupriavidus metallidurans]ABF11449.1 4-amino-4-deoxy-L-arabinose transferase or related glycosyltransferases of PMT family [Cupriavidus metallidurans CH34]QGS33352.1 4-amino-4-deoxy-L-arabinose transferase [Cupriavidus metallidurans]
MRSSSPSRHDGLPPGMIAPVVLVVIAVLLVWFGTLDARHLLRPDEGRYAEISREMFATGDWVTIRYNALKYFEKPPFHMWVTTIGYELFGVGDWQARLAVALSGLVGLVVTMMAVIRWYGARAGLLAGLALLAMPMWSVTGHFNSLDMTLSGALACVLAFMLLAQHPDASPAARRGWMLACWAAMGVAILTKGLVGIALPGLVLVVYTLVTRNLALWGRLHLVSGILAMLVVTVPWFWLISSRNPEFPHFFFIHEHWDRYTSTVHSRKGSIWYFVPLLLAGTLPWLGLTPRMWTAVSERAGAVRGMGAKPFQPALLAFIWFAAIFVFFSLSGSKLPGYIVPVFPALAILVAVALEQINERSWLRQINAVTVLSVAGIVASPFVATLGNETNPNAVFRVFAIYVGVAFAVLLIGMVLARRLLRAYGLLPSITAFSLAFFLTCTIALMGHEVMGRRASGVDLVPAIKAVLKDDMPLYGVGVLDHTLPFYLGHTLVMVAAPDELEFGTQQEPDKWIPTMDGFIAKWRDGQPALGIMSPDTYDSLAANHLPMYVVARDVRRVVVSNFPPPAAPAPSPKDSRTAP